MKNIFFKPNIFSELYEYKMEFPNTNNFSKVLQYFFSYSTFMKVTDLNTFGLISSMPPHSVEYKK